ncbi:MAG: hypothetical protein RL642_1415 [Bacteroidota bacterium]|jgi:hypothetical protein
MRALLKALCLLLLNNYVSLNAQTIYVYQGGSPNNTSNWAYTTRSGVQNPANFEDTTGTDYFDLAGNSIDIAGMTLGSITFQNTSGTPCTITNTGTVTINSRIAPTIIATDLTANFSTSGTFLYNYSVGAERQVILPASYYNITFTNTPKLITGAISISGALTESSNQKIDINNNISFLTSSATISATNTTTFVINSSGNISTDNRTNNDFPGLWEIKRGYYGIPKGTYYQLLINNATNDGIFLKGNTTVTNELKGGSSTSGHFLEINNYTLTLNGSLTGNTIYVTGTPKSGLIVGGTMSITMDRYYKPYNSNCLGSLTVNNGATLTLTDTLHMASGYTSRSQTAGVVTVATNSKLKTQGKLYLESFNSTASIGNSPGVIEGDIIVKTYIPATGRKYRFLASPVVGGTPLQWRNNGSSSSVSKVGIQITGNGGASNGFDASTTNNPSAFYYDETVAGSDTSLTSGKDDAGWTALTKGDGSVPLENGKGYRVLVRGDRTISLTANPAPAANVTTIWVKGAYPGYLASSTSSQSITKTLSYTSGAGTNKGINLIGNPYPSTIDWNAVSKGSNVDVGYMTYDPGVTGKGWTAAPRYRAYNGTTGGAGQYISSGQGFLVYTSANSNNSITFEENDKVTNVGGGFFAEKLTNHLIVSFVYDSIYYDEAYLHFRPDATNYKDRFDIVQLLNPTVNVATIDSTGKSYNINSLGTLEKKRSVYVNIANNPVSDYKIKFNDLGTFANHQVFLKDNFKNETIEIFEGKEYPISITSDPLSNANNRLELVFEPISASLKRISNINLISLETNPVIEKLVLNNNGATEIGTAQINIINTTGQLIDTKAWETNLSDSFEYQTQKLSTGIYFIEIASKNYSQTIKFTKQ